MTAEFETTPDPRPTRDRPDDDPHLWLEAIDAPEALAWVEARNAETLARYGDAAYVRDRDIARALLDRPDRIPFVQRHGRHLYNFWKDATHPRGIWRRTDEAGYRDGAPDWEILLDLDALAAAEGEDWVGAGLAILPKCHDRALLRLSRGGGDAVSLREFDLASRSFVADGFVLPEAKGSAVWLDRDTLLLSSAYGPGHATPSGYARTVRLWSRGTDVARAPILFEAAEGSMGVWGALDRSGGTERLVAVEYVNIFDTAVHLGNRGGVRRRLDLPTHAEVHLDRDQLAIRLRRAWTVGGRTFEADTVLAIGLESFLTGSRDFVSVWQPNAKRALQDVFWSAGRLIVSALDDLRPTYAVCERRGDGFEVRPLPGLPALGSAYVWPLDGDPDESDGALLALVQAPLTPPTLLDYPPATDLSAIEAPSVLRSAPAAFDARGLATTRHEAVSADGTRIPYTQTGPVVTDGDAPVHMTAYGGFRISVLPGYHPVLGRLWLERGGTSVIANLRGGGEFGTRWHEAGCREGKARAHEDFAAVASDLVARGVTRPGRIAAEGGSNGGLLIANMLTRYPEQFGALFCTIPLIDMRRYTKLLAGPSWIAEYGDPDDSDDWAFLSGISAYHAAEASRPYPPILLATSRRDDRVHPGHARKMARKLQALGYDAAFYEPAAGGHGYGKDNAEAASFEALGLNFLRRAIGWEAPDRGRA